MGQRAVLKDPKRTLKSKSQATTQSLHTHMGAAEISAGGEKFFPQGEGLSKMTQGGGLFLNFIVWVGRG